MPFQIDQHSGILIKKAARLFEQVANSNLEKLGVTYSQTIFLVRLWEQDGQNQIELTKSAGLKQPSVVRILDRMERDQLIKRVQNKDDRRMFNFYLTAKGKNACKKLEKHANAVHTLATQNLDKKDIQDLNQLIKSIIQNLEMALEKD